MKMKEILFYVIKTLCLMLGGFSLTYLSFSMQSPGAAVLLCIVFLIGYFYFNVKQMHARIRRLTAETVEEARK